MKTAKLVTLKSREARLKRKIRLHLKALGFGKDAQGSLVPPALDKPAYRSIHQPQRDAKIKRHDLWLKNNAEKLKKYFASGKDVDVRAIVPRLEIVKGNSWQSDLFRLAGLNWQIPISEGYGRRLRFLVWDESNGKLIGLLALGDAVFNLKARDEYIGWDYERRGDALVNLMDAYVLGAIPPYSSLLGGKLIASLLRTEEIVKAFAKKYKNSVGIISGKSKGARLAAITTTSALGKSSVYNRVKLNEKLLLCPIGYTSGWGHFHISDDLFEELKNYLIYVKDPYAKAFDFGKGPNWRIRVIRRALQLLGLNTELTRHGFSREVFFCPVARNALKFLRGEHRRILYGVLPTVSSIGKLAVERWMIPRAQRFPDYLNWRVEYFFDSLAVSGKSIILSRAAS